MPLGNKELIEKADLGLQELADGGGTLTPANAKKFIRLAIAESNFLSRVTVKPMAAQKERISRIGMSQRVLHAGTPGTRLPADERTKPDFGMAELDAKLFKGEVRIPDEVLEDNIEQGNFANLILEMLPEAVSRDIDEVCIQGDTASADPFLAQFDGVIKQAQSHIVDFAGARVTFADLSKMLRAIPKPYKRMRDKYEFMTSYNAEDDYRALLLQRETQLGDAAITEFVAARFRNTPIIPIGMWPDEMDVGGDETAIILTDPKNIHVGIWRQVRIEVDRDKRAGDVAFIVTVRLDVKYAVEDAVVKGVNVLND